MNRELVILVLPSIGIKTTYHSFFVIKTFPIEFKKGAEGHPFAFRNNQFTSRE